MWNDLKFIIKSILFFLLLWLILLVIIANPQLTFVIIISVILFGSALKRIISNIKLIIIDYIRHNRKSKRRETIINEEKRIKEKWINDLQNGKQVTLGEAIIQCKNDAFLIDDESFPIKEIQKLDITCEICYVLEHTIIPYYNSGSNNVISPIYFEEYGTIYTKMPNSNFGKITNTEKLTMDEYHEKIKKMFKYNEYGDQDYFKSHRCEYEKEYYLVITLYDDTQKFCSLGCEIEESDDCEIPIEAEERLIEIERCIKNLK